ncbi:hypothetical protein GCM10018954_001400 [Kutzneria kofuensis]
MDHKIRASETWGVVTRWHQNKTINAAIQELVDAGWTVVEQGHRYRMWCPCNEMWIRVDGTPKNPEGHARRMLREAARCPDRHDLSGQPNRRNT